MNRLRAAAADAQRRQYTYRDLRAPNTLGNLLRLDRGAADRIAKQQIAERYACQRVEQRRMDAYRQVPPRQQKT
jgi:aminopeptidase-like protein